MGFLRKTTPKERFVFILLIFLICGGSIYYQIFITPKNSLELYQAISFADDFDEVQKELMLKGYQGNFKEEDFNYINSIGTSAQRISQFTLFEYDDRTFVIVTSPGTHRLKVLSVEELPKEIRDYFHELP